MTEESYQQCRKLMGSINYKRGLITKAEANVRRWTRIEDGHRRELREAQADGAAKILDKAMIRLQQLREQFAAIKFPDSDIVKEYKPTLCKECGVRIAKGSELCEECDKIDTIH